MISEAKFVCAHIAAGRKKKTDCWDRSGYLSEFLSASIEMLHQLALKLFADLEHRLCHLD